MIDIISDQSLVPLGVACGVIIAVASYTAWLSSKFTLLSEKIGEQGSDLKERINRIEFKLEERFTKEEFRRWERGFFMANPSLKAPDDAP